MSHYKGDSLVKHNFRVNTGEVILVLGTDSCKYNFYVGYLLNKGNPVGDPNSRSDFFKAVSLLSLFLNFLLFLMWNSQWLWTKMERESEVR
jgi:hypothetical protein